MFVQHSWQHLFTALLRLQIWKPAQRALDSLARLQWGVPSPWKRQKDGLSQGAQPVPASMHEGLLASPCEMKGKKNIGSKFFKSPLILFVFKLWTFEMWECQKCLAQAKLTHLSLAYFEILSSLSLKSNLGPRWWAVKSLGVYPCRVSSVGNCWY